MVMEMKVGGAEFGGRAEWCKGVGGKCDGAGITEIFAPTSGDEIFITPPDVGDRNGMVDRLRVGGGIAETVENDGSDEAGDPA
jgi:hypothetical protein